MEDISTDQILSELSAGKAEPAKPEEPKVEATSNEPKDEARPTEAPVEASPFDPKAIKYVTKGGKEVVEPLEMVLKRAGMGYNYAQEMNVINQERERFKSIEDANKNLSKWEQYDKYARENPDWAKHVEETWAQRAARTQESGEVHPKILELETKLQQFEPKVQQFEEFVTKQQIQAEDKQLGDEITTTASKFKVDLSQADEQGRSLEWRVLEHMKTLGLDGSKAGHFSAAFKDYYLDNLLNRHRDQLKETDAKQKVELKNAGIVSVSRAPAPNKALNINHRSMSHDELGELAKRDPNIFPNLNH